MLNERREYEEYTDRQIIEEVKKDPKAEARLSKRNLKNSLRGIGRAMFVITKRFVETYEKEEDPDDAARNAMKSWFGFNYEKGKYKEADDINSWFKELVDLYNSTTEKEKSKIEIDSKEAAYKRTYGEAANYLEKGKDNDENAITYEKTILRAAGNGLRSRVLVADCDIFETYDIRMPKKDSDDNRDFILKNIAAYLIYRVYKNQEAVTVNAGAIESWCLGSRDVDKQHSRYKIKLNDKPEPLFMKTSMKNSTKLIVNQEILDHFRLVDYNDIADKIKDTDIIYEDQGSRKHLLKKCRKDYIR